MGFYWALQGAFWWQRMWHFLRRFCGKKQEMIKWLSNARCSGIYKLKKWVVPCQMMHLLTRCRNIYCIALWINVLRSENKTKTKICLKTYESRRFLFPCIYSSIYVRICEISVVSSGTDPMNVCCSCCHPILANAIPMLTKSGWLRQRHLSSARNPLTSIPSGLLIPSGILW